MMVTMMQPEILLLAGGFFLLVIILIIALSGPSGNKAQSRRISTIKERHGLSRESAMEAQMRKTIASRTNAGSQTFANLLPNQAQMEARLKRTGKQWTLNKFIIVNIVAVFLISSVMAILGANPLLSLLMGIVLGVGGPHFITSRFIKKRQTLFNTSFPDAIDLLVRGLRSGLPVSETLGVVAHEIPGPVGEEFRLVVERIRIGRTMEAALLDTADNIGLPEFQFFCITLAIQRETGGNLAETLSNLSDVLRKRAQMKLKIKALSSEAKASAYILGALPFFVFGIINFMNPDYASGFFSDPELMGIGLGGMVWMSIGGGIMAKMINFEI